MLRAACLLALVALASAATTYRSLGDQRIVNGTDAPAGKYPAQVSLQYNGIHRCGATIINEYWVLTAAQCVSDVSPSSLVVLSGTTSLVSGGTRHRVLQVIPHEGYYIFTQENDVGVARVETSFTWDAMTMPVAMAAQGQVTPAGSEATVIGWGWAYTLGNLMNDLQEVDFFIVDIQECRNVNFEEVFYTCICAYFPGGGKGHCNGDGGGPLFVAGEQVGIASWTESPCGIAPYPGVFTEVAAFRDWIDAKISA